MRRLAFLLALLPTFAQADISGRAAVIDGDTIEVAGQRIRLHDIDAPESDQNCRDGDGKVYACGAVAIKALAVLIRDQPVTCKGNQRDRYGRLIAVCRVGRTSLNSNMVATGMALAYRKYSQEYVVYEGQARSKKRGLWAGKFVEPWEWRRGKRLATKPANDDRARSTPSGSAATTSCVIKGNISSKGTRIYHVPGGQYYGRTKISPSKGERWFCSEAEAQAAGWRRSRR